MSIYDWSDPTGTTDLGGTDAAPQSSDRDVGGRGGVPTVGDTTDYGGPADKRGSTGLTVPGNIASWIEAATQGTAIPPAIVAAVIFYANKRGRWSGVDPETVGGVVLALADEKAADSSGAASWIDLAVRRFGPPTQEGHATTIGAQFRSNIEQASTRDYQVGPEAAEPTRTYQRARVGDVGGGVVRLGSGPTTGENAIAAIDDVYGLFQSYYGRDPKGDEEAVAYVGRTIGQVRAALSATPEGRLFRQYGSRIKDVRSWANSIYRQFMGRGPTNDEARSIIDNHWNPDQLTSYLRGQPYGRSNLGALADVRDVARKYAQQFLGREADDSEVQWLLSSGKTSPDDVSAFYEQAKERHDTGDPAFSWVGDPTAWRGLRDQLTQMWTRAGLRGEPDPHLVNQAMTQKWSLDDMQEAVNGLPAPGFANGISVGQVNRVRKIAQQWKDQYLPDVALTHDEMQQFIGLNSDEIRTYYRSLPVQMHRDAIARRASAASGPRFQEQHQQAVQAAQQQPAPSAGGQPSAAEKPSTADATQKSGYVPPAAAKAGITPAKGYKLDPSGNMVAA